jgi:hypothetical protein
MEFIHGCGHKSTEENVHGMQGVEDFIGNLGRDAERSIQHHNEDTCQRPKNSER